MKRLTIIGLWPDDVVKYCTEKCDCRRYAFDRILYHRGGRDARERICIPVVDRSGAVTTYLDLPVLFLEAKVTRLLGVGAARKSGENAAERMTTTWMIRPDRRHSKSTKK